MARPFLDVLLEIRGLLRQPPDHPLSALAFRSLTGQPSRRLWPLVATGQQLCPANPRRVYLAFIVTGATPEALSPIGPGWLDPAYPADLMTPTVFTAHDSPGLVGLDWYWSAAVNPDVTVVEVLCPPR